MKHKTTTGLSDCTILYTTTDGKRINIDKDMDLEKEDLEMLEDSIMIAINNAFKKVDEKTEKTMGKYGQGLSGLM